MTVAITHNKIATLPDEPGAEVNKAEWNDAHAIAGLGSAAEAATTDFDAAGAATAAVAAHEAAADPHGGYQKESEKGAVSGYASLDGGGTVPDAQIPAAIARDAEVTAAIATHAALAVLDGDAAAGDLGGTYPSPTVTQARGLRETAGPTTLVVGAIVDGEFLKRSGATVISATPAGGSDPAASTHIVASNTTVAAGKSSYYSRYMEVADTFTFEVGDDADMEVG